jgi:threonylcarbamoyladenosine tRNA methylthiotransferase MtaB
MSLEVKTHTFGCKVNTYDTGLIEKNLLASGVTLQEGLNQKIHILNSCAVTQEATKEAVKLVKRLRREDPQALVVVTGCAAQVDTKSFEGERPDLLVANSHKSQLPELLNKLITNQLGSDLESRFFRSNIFKKEDLEMGGGKESEHTRSFLKIQDGCNSFCSFCIIPYARGKSRSISITDLCNRVIELYEEGFREVVLTGVHIGDFEDQTRGLDDLVEALLVRTPMPRFRLSSLEPIEISDRLLELYQDDRMCPHFHMSIQSANTDVLSDMKRKYGQQEVISMLTKIRDRLPNSFVGMDVIAGFPTESFEKFEDTYLCLADLPWSRLHVFPYSERPGTRAAELMQPVAYSERKNRASRLRDLSADRYRSWGQRQVGQMQKALLLKKPTLRSDGLTREYCNIKLSNDERLRTQSQLGSEVNVKINNFQWNAGSTQDGYFEASLVGEGVWL